MKQGIIYSMTGYGEASCQWGTHEVHVQLISLNSRSFDLQAEVPLGLKKTLVSWRRLLEEKLVRGRIELIITLKNKANPLFTQDQKRVRHYFTTLKKLAEELDSTTDILGWTLQILLHEKEKEKIEDGEVLDNRELQEGIHRAIEACIASRAREGEQLQHHLMSCMEGLKRYTAEVVDYLPERKRILEEKLLEKKASLPGKEEELSWEREFAQYADKISLEEEAIRLQSHIAYMMKTFEKGHPIGKPMGFIVQEMLREVNTMGAKAQDATLQHLAIRLKELLEQVKEQAQNIV